MFNLLIARHGNTFDKGDIILRVGRGTDLSLSTSGQAQAKRLGEYLNQQYPDIAAVYTSYLQRTIETAQIALGQSIASTQLSLFDEVDYGIDEGKPESEVIARIGNEALTLWETQNTVPEGWVIDPKAINQGWQQFADQAQQKYDGKTILVVTSNGIARFAPNHAIKLSTGAVSLMTINKQSWQLEYANHRPS